MSSGSVRLTRGRNAGDAIETGTADEAAASAKLGEGTLGSGAV
jgi:hypothetical protein